jgi:CheY-like chemotaxis protein/anti-sigma regulatory factor (Ser/Thr protein kinase)
MAPDSTQNLILERLSHELRTPLTPVLVKISALQENAQTPAWMLADLSAMRRSLETEARLIDGLLDLFRAQGSRVAPHPQAADVHELLNRAIHLAVEDHGDISVAVTRRFRAGRPELHVDPARFVQACWNIVKNALQYTPSSGEVVVETNNISESHLEIRFSDTGAGIHPEFLPHVFDPFARGKHPGRQRPVGLGLGLSIARTLVRQLGGSLEAQSPGVNQGATFIMRLPVMASFPGSTAIIAPETEPVANVSQPGDPKGLRVLLVEDDPDTADALCSVLTAIGHRVTPASCVAAAIAAAREARFDILISDIGLPDGTGRDVQRWFSENSPIPGIALSGYGSPSDIERSRKAGFMLHIVKPISVATLRWAIAEVMTEQPSEEPEAASAR